MKSQHGLFRCYRRPVAAGTFTGAFPSRTFRSAPRTFLSLGFSCKRKRWQQPVAGPAQYRVSEDQHDERCGQILSSRARADCARLRPEPPGDWTANAASGPSLNLSVGYSFNTVALPSAGPVNINGLDASGHIDLSRLWSASLASSYLRTSNAVGSGPDGHLLSVLAGPVFYPYAQGNTRMFIHLSAGAGLFDSAVPVTSTTYLLKVATKLAGSAGVGVEQSLSRSFALRVNGDYLYPALVNYSALVKHQDNLRVTVSLVFRLRPHF